MSKQDILNSFLKAHSDLPKQGSAEWLAQRTGTVGGSQIATILGTNKYENIKQFILSKTDKYEFKKAAPLWFGTLFEPCIEQYVAHVYGVKTYETGSLPCKDNPRLSYSPDGISVVPVAKLLELAESQVLSGLDDQDCLEDLKSIEDKEVTVLFEFKSPYMRKIQHGNVPEYYVSQPLMGMELIPIVDLSIFIECVFRFCALEDLGTKYYSRYHFDRSRFDESIGFGGFSLFGKIPFDVDSTDLSSLNDKKTIDKLMELAVDSPAVSVEYRPIFLKTDDYMDTFHSHMYESYIEADKLRTDYIGTFTYKLFDTNHVLIPKQELITEEVAMKVDVVFEKVSFVKDKIESLSDDEFKQFWKNYDP